MSQFFTDGSAEEGTRNSGAGAIVSRGSLDNPEVVEVLKKPAGVISSLTQAELVAIELTMDWFWRRNEKSGHTEVEVGTLKKTRKGKFEELVARSVTGLGEESKQLLFVCMVGHCGLKGNELADNAASEASHLTSGRWWIARIQSAQCNQAQVCVAASSV